ncbi:MAG: lipopolysaccharide biosynthesis protein, partial [Candidatus Thorarchaeota archaeon]
LTDLPTLGVYDVVLGILFMMSFVSLAVSISLYPVLTRLRLDESDSAKKDEATTLAVGHLVRYISILLFPLAIIATMNSERILFFLFGTSYSGYPDASLSFSILLIVYVLWGITYAFHTVLRSMGEIRFFIAAGIGIIIIEIIACWYLTAMFGLLGAVSVRVVYVILLFVISYIRLRQRDIHLTRTSLYSVSKILTASLVAALVVYLTTPDNIVFFGLMTFVALLLYILCLFGIREIKVIDFRMLRILFPERSHKIITRIETSYLKEESSMVPN